MCHIHMHAESRAARLAQLCRERVLEVLCPALQVPTPHFPSHCAMALEMRQLLTVNDADA